MSIIRKLNKFLEFFLFFIPQFLLLWIIILSVVLQETLQNIVISRFLSELVKLLCFDYVMFQVYVSLKLWY